jgi:hypothetical protein
VGETTGRLRGAVIAVAVLTLTGCVGHRATPSPTSSASPSGSASLAPSATPSPSSGRGDYLALGDSVPFGYTASGRAEAHPAYVGYPTYAARTLGLTVTNASCPGETTATFISTTVRPNICGLWRVSAPLHVRYTGSQLDFALTFLRAHRDMRLVSLTLGANDLLTCRGRGPQICRTPAGFAAMLADAQRDLRRSVMAIRAVYRGPLVLVTYYSTNYATTLETEALRRLDNQMAAVVRGEGGIVADGFEAFRRAASAAGGDACRAGLLATRANGGCDIHPSTRGAQLLAATLVAAFRTRPAATSSPAASTSSTSSTGSTA